MPFVSVIIPSWNRRELLAKAIRSALAQEDISVEVLVCDDGSDDGTREMVFAWGDERVRVLTGPRAGRPAIPRNRGIAAAKGEWLAFLDDDDEWFPDKLVRQLDLAARRNALAVCANALRHIPGQEPDMPYFTNMPAELTFSDLARVNLVITSSAVVHRSLLPLVTGFAEDKNIRVGEDYALWLRIASITSFACVDAPLLVYRDTPMQSIRNQSASENETQARVFADWLLWAKHRAVSACGRIALARFLEFRFPFVHAISHSIRRRLRP